MIQTFKLLRENSDTGMFSEDSDIAIYMYEIVACYPAIRPGNEGCTVVSLRSGEDFVLRIAYAEFLNIWQISVEPINI